MGHAQQQHLRFGHAVLLPQFASGGMERFRVETPQVHPVVNQADVLLRHVVEPPKVFGHHLGQRDIEPPPRAELAVAQSAQGPVPRQERRGMAFERAQGFRHGAQPALLGRQPRAAVRLEHLAVPAQAHVVNHVHRQPGRQVGSRLGKPVRPAYRRQAVPAKPRVFQPVERTAEQVDLVSLVEQPAGVLGRPLFGPAAPRVQIADDQGYVHGCFPSVRSIHRHLASTRRMKRLCSGRSFST